MLMLKFVRSDLQVLLMYISKNDRLTYSVCHPFGFIVINFLNMRFSKSNGCTSREMCTSCPCNVNVLTNGCACYIAKCYIWFHSQCCRGKRMHEKGHVILLELKQGL